MSDMDEKKQNQKKMMIIIGLFAAVGAVVGGILLICHLCKLWPFNASDPSSAEYYNFEKNGDIGNFHAQTAYLKLKNLTDDEKKKFKEGVYNKLVENKTKYKVNFTNTKDIGFPMAAAHFLNGNIKVIDNLVDIKLCDDDKKKPSLAVLFVELACHIKLREENGKVDLQAYDVYFNMIEPIKNAKIDNKKTPEEKAKAQLAALSDEDFTKVNPAGMKKADFTENLIKEACGGAAGASPQITEGEAMARTNQTGPTKPTTDNPPNGGNAGPETANPINGGNTGPETANPTNANAGGNTGPETANPTNANAGGNTGPVPVNANAGGNAGQATK